MSEAFASVIEFIILSMSLRYPPGVFISMTMAAACWLWAVETTRAMKVDEPGSTGALKFAIITGSFPEAAGWADATVVEPEKAPTASKKSTAQTKPKIETRRTFTLSFNKFLPFLAIKLATYKLWHESTLKDELACDSFCQF